MYINITAFIFPHMYEYAQFVQLQLQLEIKNCNNKTKKGITSQFGAFAPAANGRQQHTHTHMHLRALTHTYAPKLTYIHTHTQERKLISKRIKK